MTSNMNYTVRKAADFCWAVIAPDGTAVAVAKTRKVARNIAAEKNRAVAEGRVSA